MAIPSLHIRFFLIAILASSTALCQVKVSSEIDTNVIRIGDQIGINLKASIPAGNALVFPFIGDSIRGIEVIDKGKLDTLSKKDSPVLELLQRVTVTSFDSGFYVVEPFRFILNGKDTLSTEAQLLEVRTIPVDTTKSIKDIKPIMEPPFDWGMFLSYLLIVALVVLLGYIGYRHYQKNKNKQSQPVSKPIPTKPPHEIALERLMELEREKLWQQGAFKAYHIRLTEIIREYIDSRYGINSMEMTTDETIAALERVRIQREIIQPLEQLFRLADMVKFAKAIPVGPENEASIGSAREFIRNTTKMEKPKEVQS